MVYKRMFGVEYYTDYDADLNDSDRASTFDIFATKKEAENYASKDVEEPKYIFVADFDKDSVYEEDEGGWNYDDNAGLYKNLKILKDFRKGYKPDAKQKVPKRSK